MSDLSPEGATPQPTTVEHKSIWGKIAGMFGGRKAVAQASPIAPTPESPMAAPTSPITPEAPAPAVASTPGSTQG